MSKLFKSRKFLTAVLAVVIAALDAFAIKAELIGQVEGVGVMILDALVALGFIAGTAYEDGKIIPHQIQGDAQITSDPYRPQPPFGQQEADGLEFASKVAQGQNVKETKK